VSTRIRPWLSLLLALSANSPFWEGSDTGYASFRTTVFSRWPTAGPQGEFADRAEYSRLIGDLIAIDVIKDENMVYFDARPSNRYATVEVRVADVCTDVEDAVLIAGLVRGLVSTCALEAVAGTEPVSVRQELLRAATWRASRSGLDGRLVDLVQLRPVPAPEALRSFLTYVRPALEAAGDFDQVSELLGRTLAGGGGAARQRRIFEETGWLPQVVIDAVERTCPRAPAD
jgi:carboxylate-amine ligase